jgi:hypothetical protein
MARRQTPVLRNLDDRLKVLGFLSLRSCGLVLIAFAAVHGVEALFGLVSLLVGTWAFLLELGLAAALGVVLHIAERADDEHLVPSALRYLLDRPWAVLYSGGRAEHQHRGERERILHGFLHH